MVTMRRKENSMSSFEEIYIQVRPIVLRLRQLYRLHMWEAGDWDQEGMLILYQLLKENPELEESYRLFPCFKTKFSNYVKDQLRRQISKKRGFSGLHYTEIGELSYCLAADGVTVDDYVAYREQMGILRSRLCGDDLIKLEAVVAGECFRGKAEFIRKLRTILGES